MAVPNRLHVTVTDEVAAWFCLNNIKKAGEIVFPPAYVHKKVNLTIYARRESYMLELFTVKHNKK